MALPATPSFSLAEANSIVEIEVQADQLLGYIDKLTTLADRACTTAIRQTQTAHLIDASRHGEINDLRKKIDQQNDKLHEQEIAIVRLQHESKAQLAALETQLRQNRPPVRDEPELHALRRENTRLMKELRDSQEITPRKVEPEDAPSTSVDDSIIDELRLQIANRDENLLAKNNAIKAMEAEFRVKISGLEERLREAREQLEKREEEIIQKDHIIQATASKEAEMGNLIKQLSAECAALSEELHRSNSTAALGETKNNSTVSEGTIWRRVISRLQEEPQ